MVAHFPLDETSGSRVDVLLGEILSDINTVGSTTGKINTAALFVNANEEELDAANSGVYNFDGTEDFTIACWAWVDSLSPPGSDQVIFGKYDDDGASNDRQYLCFFDNSTNQFRAIISEDGAANSADVSPTNNITANTWFHLIMQYVASTKTLTLTQNNGTGGDTASASATNAIINQSARVFAIGKAITAGDPALDGRVDELTIWQRVLTSTEKSEHYNSGAGVNLQDFLPVDIGPASVGGFLSGITVNPVSGIIGGYELSRGFLVPDAHAGGFLFAKTGGSNVGIFGGYTTADGVNVGPAKLGGFINSVQFTNEDPCFIGGALSGLFQNRASVGGYTFGRPAFNKYVASRARTLVTATSQNVADQGLNIDAQIVFKGLSSFDFNARVQNIKTFGNDINAQVVVEKFQIPPTVLIHSVELLGASGEVGPLNTLSPAGARQVRVTASGSLNDGEQFVSAHIDFADPFTNDIGTANKPFLSVSGFTGAPPWIAIHDYDMSGIYQVTARAQDNRGMVGMAMSGVALNSGLIAGDHYPVISISGNPRFGEVPPSMQVNYTLESSGLFSFQYTAKEVADSLVQSPTDDRILWQFGNRERSTKKNPFTFYQSPGLFAPKVMYKFNHPSGHGRLMVSDSLLLGFVR